MLADTQRFCPRRPLSGCGPAQHGCGQHALFGQRPFRGVFAARHAEQLCRVTEGVPARRRGRWFLVEGARVPAVEGVLAWRREHGFPQGAPGLVPVSVTSPNSCSRATGSRPRPWPLMARASLSGWCWWGPPVSRRLVTGGRAHLQPMCCVVAARPCVPGAAEGAASGPGPRRSRFCHGLTCGQCFQES